jgi:hypothetical protein
MISSRFVWCGLSSDITAWTHGCLACQWGKIHRHTILAPQPITIPLQCFSHLHVDLVGSLQYSNSFNYIFTIIDRTSKWMEAIPLSETFVTACAKALTFTWISRFGVPKRSLQIVGRNSLLTFGLNFARCSTSRIGKQLHTILSRIGQSKDHTATSRMCFAHVQQR